MTACCTFNVAALVSLTIMAAMDDVDNTRRQTCLSGQLHQNHGCTWVTLRWLQDAGVAADYCHREHLEPQALRKSLVSWFWALSTTKDYTRAKNKLQSTSRLFIPKVIIPQVSFLPNHNSNSVHNSEHDPSKTITYLGAYLYSVSTQHGSLYLARWPLGLHRNQY